MASATRTLQTSPLHSSTASDDHRRVKRKSTAEREEADRIQAAARSSVIKETRKVQQQLSSRNNTAVITKASSPQIALADASQSEQNLRVENEKFVAFSTKEDRVTWCLPERYRFVKKIGYGASGVVIKARDSVTNQLVAIKKQVRPFRTEADAQRALREMRLLELLKHDNIVPLLDVFTAQRTYNDFQDIYMVMAYAGDDLMEVIKQRSLRPEDIQFVIYQILRGLKFIHSAGVIHRDLKPQNIAVTEDNEVRILDFGLARKTSGEMTGYVMTKWWRAPEVMYKWMHYTQTVDIWSVGCIMGEMISRQPLFKSDTPVNHLRKILQLLGSPNQEFLEKVECPDTRAYLASSVFPARDFHEVFPTLNDKGIDLLKRMLEIDPDRRITAADALTHEYFAAYHDADDEPVCVHNVDEPYEGSNIPMEGWKSMIWTEIQNFDPNANSA